MLRYICRDPVRRLIIGFRGEEILTPESSYDYRSSEQGTLEFLLQLMSLLGIGFLDEDFHIPELNLTSFLMDCVS